MLRQNINLVIIYLNIYIWIQTPRPHTRWECTKKFDVIWNYKENITAKYKKYLIQKIFIPSVFVGLDFRGYYVSVSNVKATESCWKEKAVTATDNSLRLNTHKQYDARRDINDRHVCRQLGLECRHCCGWILLLGGTDQTKNELL